MSFPGTESLAVVDAFPADVEDDVTGIIGHGVAAQQWWDCQCNSGTYLDQNCNDNDPHLGLYDDPITESMQFDFGGGSTGDVTLGVFNYTGPREETHTHDLSGMGKCSHHTNTTIYGMDYTYDQCVEVGLYSNSSIFPSEGEITGAIWYGSYMGGPGTEGGTEEAECSNPDLPLWDSGSDISLQNCVEGFDYDWNCPGATYGSTFCFGWQKNGSGWCSESQWNNKNDCEGATGVWYNQYPNSLTMFSPTTLGSSSCQEGNSITGNQLLNFTYYEEYYNCENSWHKCYNPECDQEWGTYLGCDHNGTCENATCVWGTNGAPTNNISEVRGDQDTPECMREAEICGYTGGNTCTPEGTWYGSLLYLEPQKGYWVNTSDNFSFQYNLVEVARCSDRDFTDQQTCEGSGNFWRSRLIGGTGSTG
jgi:hypothetical protein